MIWVRAFFAAAIIFWGKVIDWCGPLDPFGGFLMASIFSAALIVFLTAEFFSPFEWAALALFISADPALPFIFHDFMGL